MIAKNENCILFLAMSEQNEDVYIGEIIINDVIDP
jgi:hypothetical protein